MTTNRHDTNDELTPRTNRPEARPRRGQRWTVGAWTLLLTALGVVVALAQLLVEVT
ncbi:hypothetical protein [Cellulosimicrobium protaetiae]